MYLQQGKLGEYNTTKESTDGVYTTDVVII